MILLLVSLAYLAKSQVPVRSQLQYNNFCPENPGEVGNDPLAWPAHRNHTFPHAWFAGSDTPVTYSIPDCCHRDFTFFDVEGDYEEYDDALESDKKGWDPTQSEPKWGKHVFYEPSSYYSAPKSPTISDPDSFYYMMEVKLAKGPPNVNSILKVYDKLVWLNYTIFADSVYNVSTGHQFNLGLFMDAVVFILRADNDRYWPFPRRLWGDAPHMTTINSTYSRPHRLSCTQIDLLNVAVALENVNKRGLQIDFVIQVPAQTANFYKEKFEIAMTSQYGIYTRQDLNDPESDEWKLRYPLGHTATLLSIAAPGVPPSQWKPWFQRQLVNAEDVSELNPVVVPNATNATNVPDTNTTDAGSTRRRRRAPSAQESCTTETSANTTDGTYGWQLAISQLTDGSVSTIPNVSCAEALEILRPADIDCTGTFTNNPDWNFVANCSMAISDTQECHITRTPGWFGGRVYCESANGTYIVEHPIPPANTEMEGMIVWTYPSIFAPPEGYEPVHSVTDRINCEDAYESCDACAPNHTQLELLQISVQPQNGGRLCRPPERYITCARECGQIADEEWVGLGFAIFFGTLVVMATALLAMRDKDEIRHLQEEPVVTLAANEPVQKAGGDTLADVPLEPMLETELQTNKEGEDDEGEEFIFDDSYGDGDYQSDDEMTSNSDSDLKSDVDDEPIMKKVQIHF